MLDLVRTSKNSSGEWSADDYDVFDGKIQAGRITLTSQAPPGTPWLWIITARDPNSTQNRGYAVSREQALKEFNARWRNPARF
jgi:hypothetical protein